MFHLIHLIINACTEKLCHPLKVIDLLAVELSLTRSAYLSIPSSLWNYDRELLLSPRSNSCLQDLKEVSLSSVVLRNTETMMLCSHRLEHGIAGCLA